MFRSIVKRTGTGIIIASLCLLSLTAVSQDDVPDWVKKMEMDALKMMDSMQRDPAIKKMMKDAEKQSANPLMGINDKAGSSKVTIPIMKGALPDSLKDTLNYSKFKQYTERLYRRLESCLSPQQKKNIENIHPSIKNNPRVLGVLSVFGWYNGGTPESGVIAARAVTLPGATAMEVNNLAAILIMGGVAEKAIPILLSQLSRSPGNTLLLNNLGQAYAAVGATSQAIGCLQQVLKSVPKHPEANCTMGHIEAARGNREGAIEYAERSLSGGYNNSAFHLLAKMKPDRKKFLDLLAGVDLPGTFNVYKYELPRQQILIKEAPEIEAEHKAFIDGIDAVIDRLEPIALSNIDKGEAILKSRVAELQRDPMSYVKNPNRFVRPLAVLGNMVLQKYGLTEPDMDLDQRLKESMQEINEKYERKTGGLRAEYAERMSKFECGEGNGRGCAILDQLAKELCKKIDEATHELLRAKAMVRTDWQNKKKNIALKSFFLFSKLGYIAAQEKHLAIGGIYQEAIKYLTTLKSLAVYDQARHSYCIPPGKHEAPGKRFAFDLSAECPFELEIPMIIGKLGINCEEASFGISAGATFKFTQNFASRQSTVSVGAGLGLEHGVELGGAEAKAGAHIGQSLFLTFDKNNKIVDAGMQFGAGLSAGYGVKSTIKVDGGEADISRNFGEKKLDIGYSFGINSGFEFNEGPLKELLSSKPEKQINPKVPIYGK